MGSRNRFTKRTKTKPEALEYTTSAGRGKNRTSTKSKTIPANKRPTDMRKGVTYGDAGRPYKGPGGNPNGSGQGQAQQAPPAPKLPPRPSSSKPAPPKKTTPKSTKPKTSSKKTTPKAATSANAQNLRSGPTPPKATKPAKKVYGSKGKKGLKQSSRMAAALKSLKVKAYKKKK